MAQLTLRRWYRIRCGTQNNSSGAKTCLSLRSSNASSRLKGTQRTLDEKKSRLDYRVGSVQQVVMMEGGKECDEGEWQTRCIKELKS